MDTLRAILDQLEDRLLDYVKARSETDTDKEAYEAARIHKSVFYGWAREERDRLNDLAQQLKRERAIMAIYILRDATEEAAKVKAAGLRSRDERIKQNAATEILDRTIGKAINQVDVTSNGQNINSNTVIILPAKDFDNGSD